MRYCIRVAIIHKDPAKVQEVLNTLPDKADAGQWEVGHSKSDVVNGDEEHGGIGNFIGTAIIYFNVAVERDNCVTDIKAIITKAAAFESNTKIIQFNSSHYQDGVHINVEDPCITTREDEIMDKATGLKQKVI